MRNNNMQSPATRRHGDAPGAAPQAGCKPLARQICLPDVIHYIATAKKRRLQVLSHIMEVRTLALGIPGIGFEGIALAGVLSFVATANNEERALIREALNGGREQL